LSRVEIDLVLNILSTHSMEHVFRDRSTSLFVSPMQAMY